MSFLSLILSSPLIYISYSKNHKAENFYVTKLIFIWLISQVYITINYKIPFPMGVIINIILISNSKYNRNSKYTALLVGIISLVISNCISLLYNW
ncbi:hypothetical protein AC231_10955 [Clostridium pasteurianum]|nr:hypothetical protein AQ983_18090 [Clostridium pasteurianum DSM 525 = ATCC 6013]AOZ80712.1 hypothetical protein AQ984_18085 [Clostridium pasteurianum]ELP57729.1 hypothetical protein F502_18187 [Clostridium pasteurianum DSM 525 = ATCC 6013]OMH21101.1 hypothetical protein AC231_10955 [Clostridium pasteurianum]